MRERIDAGKLKGHFREIVESLGYEYVGTELERARSGVVVRIYIDLPGGIGHAECEAVSRDVAAFLDASEEAGTPFFPGAYYIEVSSPGLERPLFTPDHYRRFAGKCVEVRTAERKRITGVIASCDEDGRVTLTLGDGSSQLIAFESIERAHLVFVLEKGEKKSHGKKQAK